MPQQHVFSRIVLGLGLAFLYLPLLILVIFSFNGGRLVTVWAGFSTKWYQALLHDEQLIQAAWTSLKIAFWSAHMATILGATAAYAIIRLTKFRTRILFSSLINAPLIMPDVVVGLSLLLLFVSFMQVFNWPTERGAMTIWIAHVTFCTAYTTAVIAARLQGFNRSFEEAAMDLGARPLKIFFKITLPIILPAFLAAWLLAFTLSLDDLVIASFVTGPSATTLPMVIFSSVRLGVSPEINALASVFIFCVSLTTLISWICLSRTEAKKSKLFTPKIRGK